MQRRTYVASVLGLAATGGVVTAATSAMQDGDGTPRAPAECPSFDGSADTVCVDDDGAVSFSRSDAVVPTGGQLVVTLANEDVDAVGLNPYAWTAYRRDDGGWTQVAPDAFVEPWRSLEPGESLSWRVRVGGGERTRGGDAINVGPLDLDGGEYAFVVVAAVDGDRTEFVAPFTVE